MFTALFVIQEFEGRHARLEHAVVVLIREATTRKTRAIEFDSSNCSAARVQVKDLKSRVAVKNAKADKRVEALESRFVALNAHRFNSDGDHSLSPFATQD